MNSSLNNLQSLHKRQGKSTNYQAQIKRIYKAFNEPKTMLKVSIETGILRANITRYVAKLKKVDQAIIYKFGICPISKRSGVQFITTNQDLINAKTNCHE